MRARDRELAHRFWSGTPAGALVPLLLAVFFTFAAIGFLVDVAGGGRLQPRALAAIVAFSGLIAVAYALIAVRRRFWLFAPLVALQLLVPRWVEVPWPSAPAAAADARRPRLLLDAGGATAGLALGYAFFMMFIVRQGLRRVRTEAEMALARDIHLSLVPPVALATPWCEMHGRSVPASEVGGDLVDALEVDGRPLGFVADVSGHGDAVASVDVAPGDLLAALTDGFTETMDRAGRELGLGPIEAALGAHARAPLGEILDRLLRLARAHGPQQDDRTLLLVRVHGPGAG